MSSYVSASLRRLVRERAEHICEYCLIHEDQTFVGCQVEHIISEKHGGETVPENLAYACVFCNRFKGTDIGSIVPQSLAFSRLYHPRTDSWYKHFRLHGTSIAGQSEVCHVTARLLQFNSADRLLERATLMARGEYPSEAALRRMRR